MNVKLIDSCGLNKNHHNGLLSLSAFKRRKLVRSVAALTGAAICSITTIAHSLGLGEIQSSTFIGQPLKANIALVSLDGAIDLDTIIVRQVTREEASKLGVDVSTGNQFTLEIDQGQGVPFIMVESRESIKEPYLNLLVELRWPNGVVYREYPILLDPPPKAPVVTSKRTEQAQPRNVQPARSTAKPEAKATVAGTRRLQLDPLATADGKYRVQSGDTLSKIAERWRDGTDRGIYDTMQWLYENNLHAFTNQNIDLLRAGAVLQMPDLSAYVVDNEVPSKEEQAQAVQVKEPSTEGGVKLSETDNAEKQAQDSVEHVDLAAKEPSRGLLTVGEANQDDTTREMIDMLVRENESLRARVEKIENSEYLETLKQLIVLQRQQISELRSRIGVSDSDNNEEIDSLLAKIGAQNQQQQTLDNQLEVVVNDEKLATEDLSETSEVELASENVTAKKAVDEELAPVKVDPVLSAPVMADNEQKNWLFWLILGGGAAIIAGFAGLLVYLRKTSETSQQFEEAEKMDDDLFEVLDEDSGLSLDEMGSSERFDEALDTKPLSAKPVVAATTIKPFKSEKEQEPLVDDIHFDGDITLIQDPKKDEDENWLGDSAEVTESDLLDMDAAMKEVQDAFDDLLLDESVLEELEGEASLEGMTQELPSAEKSQKAETEVKQEKEPKKKVEPRTEDELRLSIAEKMAQYNPEEYRKEIENLGLLELDELNDFDEEHDEIDTTVYRAMMFCEFKKFTKARELVQASLDEGIDDSRLLEALEQIDALEASGKNDSKQAG